MKDLAAKLARIIESSCRRWRSNRTESSTGATLFRRGPGNPQTCNISGGECLRRRNSRCISERCLARVATAPTALNSLSGIWVTIWMHSSKASISDRYVTESARPSLHVYHLVGALDPLTDGDVKTKIGDGLPETLQDWVQRGRRRPHQEIKLDGDNLPWDIERILSSRSLAERSEFGDGVALLARF